MTMAPTPHLKPCPFCGGEPEIERTGTARQSCIVACTECGARRESGEIGAGRDWNMRTLPSEQAQVLACARDEIRPWDTDEEGASRCKGCGVGQDEKGDAEHAADCPWELFRRTIAELAA